MVGTLVRQFRPGFLCASIYGFLQGAWAIRAGRGDLVDRGAAALDRAIRDRNDPARLRFLSRVSPRRGAVLFLDREKGGRWRFSGYGRPRPTSKLRTPFRNIPARKPKKSP